MSRWLRSVNTILEKLDDGTAVAAEAGGTAAATARRLLSRTAAEESGSDYDDSDDGDESDAYEEEEETGNEKDDGGENEGEFFSSEEETGDEYETDGEGKEEEEVDFATDDRPPPAFSKEQDAAPHRSDAAATVTAHPDSEKEKEISASSRRATQGPGVSTSPTVLDGEMPAKAQTPSPSSGTPTPTTQQSKPISTVHVQSQSTKHPPPPPPPAAPRSVPTPPPPPAASIVPAVSGSTATVATAAANNNKKLAQDYKKALSEIALLQASNASLRQQLDRAEDEVRAQHDELMAAAASLSEERAALKEEKDEFLADHEEEMENVQHRHQKEVQKLHKQYQAQIKGLQNSLKEQKAQFAKQGGDLSVEMDKVMEERDLAVERAAALQSNHDALFEQFDTLSSQHDALRQQCAALENAAESARQAERAAEEMADAALEQHKHQLALRQAREAELERTVADLGAALTALQTRSNGASSHHESASQSFHAEESLREYKEKCDVMAEELESAQTELQLVKQRCAALEIDVQELSRERDAEIASSQQRQRQHDEQFAALLAQLSSHMEPSMYPNGTLRSSDDSRLRHALHELDEAKKQVESLSDQLMRQQGAVESSKSEVLALKGRLQATNSRADAAEVALASATASSYDIEGGGSGSKSRRRIKGGVRALGGGPSRPSHLAPRSVRAALGLRVVSGSAMEQVALTIDAIDNWMVDTGAILKTEPLARFAFAVYLAILHCWCFALVFFHAVESEHGDISSLTHRGRPLHPGMMKPS
jgi:predicted  nucleic acid-binding Zn-ribbon protein